MTVRVDNPAPATYDLGQIKALAAARFGSALMDCNEVKADNGSTLIAVYLPSTPNGAKATAWTNDLATYTPTSPTAADLAANLAALQAKAQAALGVNAAYLAKAPPSNSDIANQVIALTKQCNGIIRLLLGQFDSTAGT